MYKEGDVPDLNNLPPKGLQQSSSEEQEEAQEPEKPAPTVPLEFGAARAQREQAEAEILRCHEKSLPLRQRTEAQLSAEQDVWYEAALRLLQLLPPSAAVHLSRARLLLGWNLQQQRLESSRDGAQFPR